MIAMVLSGDEINPELKSLVANSREKSENRFNDVLSALKGKVLSFPMFITVTLYFRLVKLKFFAAHPNCDNLTNTL